MGLSRAGALVRIESLSLRVGEHLDAMRSEPFAMDYNHWRGEVQNWTAQIEALARHVGQRTGSEVLSRVAKWKQALAALEAARAADE